MNEPLGPENSLRAQAKRAALRMFKILLGLFLILLGLLSVPTPLPIGLGLSLVGLAVLASESPWIVPMARWARRKLPALDELLRNIKDKLPKAVRGFVEATESFRP